ncbi:hypothetical protein DOY81_012666, partial [Sarcophaga bullata]
MKILFKILLAFMVIGIKGDAPQFNVGAIFDTENSELEMAFRTTVDRSNILERSFQLVPIVVYANNDDSFLMEKTVSHNKSCHDCVIFGPQTGESS